MSSGHLFGVCFFLSAFASVLQSLGISKPMVCQTYGLHAGHLSQNGNHEKDENDEDNSDSYKHWELSAGLVKISDTETTE